jgi:hypothetical protein
MNTEGIRAFVDGLTDDELDALTEAVRTRREADGDEDITKQLSEYQLVALSILLEFADPGARGVDWDLDNPEEFDDVELARWCLLQSWPVDDWNRRYDEQHRWFCAQHGDYVENRQDRLLEQSRPECVAE